ncbi:MAG TPA: hypothetical protein PLY93_11830, partial [Turneriella sp.]|nr:hypothetical protein [Turneriella sp.]
MENPPVAENPKEQKAPHPKKQETPAHEKQNLNKEKKKDHTALIERIRDVLNYGNSLQVRDTLNTLTRLTADEQKSLLPELKKTCESKDPLVLRKIAEFIGVAPFNDLDNELVKFLDDKNNDPLFFATVGALVKKKPESAR